MLSRKKKFLLTPFGRVTCFLAPTTSPSGAFKRGAERHAKGDPEADVTQGSSHGHPNRHADCDARTWCRWLFHAATIAKCGLPRHAGLSMGH
jgi:hypothetical protein